MMLSSMVHRTGYRLLLFSHFVEVLNLKQIGTVLVAGSLLVKNHVEAFQRKHLWLASEDVLLFKAKEPHVGQHKIVRDPHLFAAFEPPPLLLRVQVDETFDRRAHSATIKRSLNSQLLLFKRRKSELLLFLTIDFIAKRDICKFKCNSVC